MKRITKTIITATIISTMNLTALATEFPLALTPNFNTMILSGAFALKEKFHCETFLFVYENPQIVWGFSYTKSLSFWVTITVR